MTKIEFLDLTPASPSKLREPENWYTEPFTKRTGCKVPGQCGGDCNCGCPYNTMTETERLPLIEEIAAIFPDEWLAFIISATEDEDYEPIHGKLVAHSLDPEEIYNAVNAVLWNQHVYIYFNGNFETMQASYGPAWEQSPAVAKRAYSGPQPASGLAPTLPDDLLGLIHSALDQLYDGPRINEAIRRLRLAQVRAMQQDQTTLTPALNAALDKLETPLPFIDEVIWQLEEVLVDLPIRT